MNGKAKFSSEAIHSFVDELFGEDLHAKWVTSLANATHSPGVVAGGERDWPRSRTGPGRALASRDQAGRPDAVE